MKYNGTVHSTGTGSSKINLNVGGKDMAIRVWLEFLPWHLLFPLPDKETDGTVSDSSRRLMMQARDYRSKIISTFYGSNFAFIRVHRSSRHIRDLVESEVNGPQSVPLGFKRPFTSFALFHRILSCPQKWNLFSSFQSTRSRLRSR